LINEDLSPKQLTGGDLRVLKQQGSTNEIIAQKIGLSENAYKR